MRRCAPSLEDSGRVPATLERLWPANVRTLRLPLVTYNRKIVHRSGFSHEAMSFINFIDMVRLLAEQALRHYASPDSAVSRVGGGQGLTNMAPYALKDGRALAEGKHLRALS